MTDTAATSATAIPSASTQLVLLPKLKVTILRHNFEKLELAVSTQAMEGASGEAPFGTRGLCSSRGQGLVKRRVEELPQLVKEEVLRI